MSREGDRASVLRTTKVRTKLRGDGSWLQRRDEPQAETQEEEKPWLAEVRARRLNGAPIETSPVSSPVKATPPPVQSDTESKPATQGYLIRGVFTKLEKPASTPSSNGTSTTKTFTKKPSETYKRIAPHIVRNTSENPEGQLSFEEQERRTEAALHVMKTKAANKRSYVLSAAKLYETKDTPPDTSLATSDPSFVAKRVEIFDDADSAVEPSPAVPPTSAASAPAPKPQSASSTDTIAALSDTLISLDTNPSSAENDKQELAEEEGGPVDSPTPEDSVEQEPDTEPRDGEPITGDLLGFSDNPEEPAEPVPSSPGRWSQDLLTGLGGLSMQQQEEEKQTDETAVETQSSADPFDPNPIGTASHNSPPDLLEPSADVSINSSATTEETMESPRPKEFDCIMAVELPEYSCPNIPKPTPVGVEKVIFKMTPMQYEPMYKMEEEVPSVVGEQVHHYFLQAEKVEEEDEGDKAEEEEEDEGDKIEEEEENEEKVEEEEENKEEKVGEEEENKEEKVGEEEENKEEKVGEEEEEKVEEEEENEEEKEKVEEEKENEEEEGKVEEKEVNEEEEKVQEEKENEKDEGKVEEDEEEDQKVEEEEESEEEEDEEKDGESSQGSWNTTWEIPHEASTVESQKAEKEDKAGDQQTLIMFERKSTENDSPWDKWMTPTVYTISTGTGDGDEEEVKEEERPAVVAEEQRVPTPEPESKKPFVYVREYVDASEPLLNLRDPLNGLDDFTSSSISYSYSSPSSYTRLSPSSTCTYCGKQVGNDAKISIEHLNINCHPDCFKCDVCSRPMGDLLHSMFLHNKKVHCESCYATVI
ncbi:zinc finger protein 185 [Poecilia reticulata]|uniref:zinc finger protein 185 n=1 Tax=Poecilia reticulata TaxID=8081 RepID=UPI0004A4C8AE|nr:PREDICTED: inner centromere protein A-like [Poecilia reticulata]